MPAHKGGKKGNKKYGRNKDWCKAYKLRGQQEINQALRLAKHLIHYPDDLCAMRRLGELPELAKRKAQHNETVLRNSPGSAGQREDSARDLLT